LTKQISKTFKGAQTYKWTLTTQCSST